MPIFYEQAIRAGADGEPVDWLSEDHLLDWKGLATALDRLTPEQRCDAIYADWLLQLNGPAHLPLLAVRNLLIGQGALAANYLAELAQNADDASDGQEAHVRIVLNGDWLFVCNNGRKVTSLNLLGLSRFFVHAAGGVVELNQETIGKFGIGFKSCYRIASKVYVHTWDATGYFGFRLPICREGDEDSRPESERLEKLLRKLRLAGVTVLDPRLRDIKWLGYCTPEFQKDLPPELAQLTSDLRQSERGTLFCFKLRPDRRGEVHGRISGQAHEVYELCPLFLPTVRVVQLGRHELRMREIRRSTENDLPGQVEATKVELIAQAIGERPSTSRFWRLRGINPGDLWQAAIHADSQFRLRVEQEEDEHGTTVKDGAAYAFFPLNAVTRTWPFRLHLHLRLPTNLARDDWNPDEAPQVQDQIQRAISGLAQWLEAHTDKWHPDWTVESLVARIPNQNEAWAWQIWNRLCAERSERKLVRSLTNQFVPGARVKAIYLVERPEARAAWQQLLGWQPATTGELDLVGLNADAPFHPPEVTAQDVASICKAALQADPTQDERHRTALTAFLGCHNLMFHRYPGPLLDFLKLIQCETATKVKVPLTDLCDQPGGAELSEAWHQTIRTIDGWARDVSWATVTVRGRPLAEQLRKLSKPEFNPAWPELSIRLGTEEQWKAHGEQFWRTRRTRCPETARQTAIVCLRVPNQAGNWVPLSDLWLGDDLAIDCFCGLLKKWDRPRTDQRRRDIADQIEEWGLLGAWESAARTLLKDKLPGALSRLLNEHANEDCFSIVFSRSFEAARRRVGEGWKHIIDDAEKAAVSRFVIGQLSELRLAKRTLVSRTVSDQVRAALELLPEFASAPVWLTDSAYQQITRLGLIADFDFKFLSQQQLSANEERLARDLLEKFCHWPTATIGKSALEGLEALCSSTSLRQRRDWLIGLGPQKSRRLRDLILPRAVSVQPKTTTRLKEYLLKKAEWRGEPLPSSLVEIKSLAESCIQPERLEADTISGTLIPLELEQLSSDLPESTELAQAVKSGSHKLFGSPRPLNLRWRYEEEIVATLDDAPFAVENDRIIVQRFRPPADEEQCRRVLGVFETNATVSDAYEADAVLSPFERYQKHRDTIRQTLLRELVAKVGYEKHHILRELLQNAESAYASKKNPERDAWFEFVIQPASQAGQRKVQARHAGRAFNEPDVAGRNRQDVERIWRLAAESERTADEVGRFNRGFKTLFTVAANGLVHIRSGDYEFEVIDLLMLKPADPRPNPERHSPLTEFTFEADYKHALEMLRLDGTPRPNSSLPIINPATLVFLGYLQRIRVVFEARDWHWRISRSQSADNWRHVNVQEEGSQRPERFQVFTGTAAKLNTSSPARRFAAAVRLDDKGLPIALEKAWRKFHLTFETEHDFPLDFLVNGDFDADQGRVGLRNIARSGLVELAYEAIVHRAIEDIRKTPSKDVWLAWARVLHLKDAPTELDASSELRPLRQQAEKAAQELQRIIPHGAQLVPASRLEFPSMLFRRLAGVFGTRWSVNQSKWIDAEIAATLPDGEHNRVTFDGWIISQPPQSPLLRLVDGDLRSETSARIRFSGPEKDELDKAKGILAEKLRPAAPPTPAEPALPVLEPWTVAKLWMWWEHRGRPIANYTLEGDENWRLLYSSPEPNSDVRRLKLKADLLSATSDEGKRVWYRLFGLACLMAAGRRMSEVRQFWNTELNNRQFWERTAKKSFAEGTDALFAEVIRRPFTNLSASGESAYFWRRIFYDVRKIHKLVWEDEFQATLLQLVASGRGTQLLQFLKTGQLPGQQAWVGVFGQSAGAPLFFVVRELCRLGVITDPAVKPFAFFVSTPVRRAMERIGWLGADLGNRVDFESLSSLSESLHRRLAGSPDHGLRLLPYYDIPLLHLGLEG